MKKLLITLSILCLNQSLQAKSTYHSNAAHQKSSRCEPFCDRLHPTTQRLNKAATAYVSSGQKSPELQEKRESDGSVTLYFPGHGGSVWIENGHNGDPFISRRHVTTDPEGNKVTEIFNNASQKIGASFKEREVSGSRYGL